MLYLNLVILKLLLNMIIAGVYEISRIWYFRMYSISIRWEASSPNYTTSQQYELWLTRAIS